MTAIPTGRFVWFEYVTSEAQKAQGFFGELFNWKTQAVPMPQGTYTMIEHAGKTIGGYMATPEGAPKQAHWLAHLQVASAAESAAQIKALGGKVRKEPFTVGDHGTMAIVADPENATFALWQPNKPETSEWGEAPGNWCWNELACQDPAKELAFYSKLGGFVDKPMEMGEMGTYHLLEAGGKGRAGLMKASTPNQPTRWMPYVHVASADQTAAKAQKLGATLVMPPSDIPNIGRFAIFMDPLGCALGILQPAPM